MGACANAPMAQIGKDYYEDLTPAMLRDLIGRFSKGEVPVPGPQNGRYAAEPLSGLTSLKDFESGRQQYNASAQAAVDLKDTVKRIDGTEVPLLTPWLGGVAKAAKPAPAPKPAKPKLAAAPAPVAPPAVQGAPLQPKGLKSARGGKPDDLKIIVGIGPKLEILCHSLGFFHFDQIANWTAAEIAWVDDNLAGFKGRVTRDKWVDQAKDLAPKAKG
jgi:NADH-quinone oxidoreductase subunit E